MTKKLIFAVDEETYRYLLNMKRENNIKTDAATARRALICYLSRWYRN